MEKFPVILFKANDSFWYVRIILGCSWSCNGLIASLHYFWWTSNGEAHGREFMANKTKKSDSFLYAKCLAPRCVMNKEIKIQYAAYFSRIFFDIRNSGVSVRNFLPTNRWTDGARNSRSQHRIIGQVRPCPEIKPDYVRQKSQKVLIFFIKHYDYKTDSNEIAFTVFNIELNRQKPLKLEINRN